MKKPALCIFLLIIALTQGCCTIFTHDPQTITITSRPEGADVRIGPYTEKTPLQVTLPRGKDYIIEATYGQQTKKENLHKTIENIYWLNLIPPLWPGLVIDMATGKMFTYEPLDYDISFYR